MEALVSDLTKKPFKNWRNLFQIFVNEAAFTHAQKNEDGLSCFLMGFYYEQGLIVERDLDLALKYFRLGANKRDALCLYKLYEIHSGKNFYGVEPDKEVAFLYLIWAVAYMFPIYGSYMCLDIDLELQSYFKNTLKLNKEEVFQLIDDYEDDIFAHDKDFIKVVFKFLIEFVAPNSASNFKVQEEYHQMIEDLINIAERSGDPRFPILFLFKCVIWDFKGVTDRKHKKILDIIRKKKAVSFIYQQLKSVFDFISIVGKKHTIFSRLLHFHSVEIFLQIKYNCDSDDITNKDEACDYLANFLYSNISLIDNNSTKSMAIHMRAKYHMNGAVARTDINQAIDIIESSRNATGFTEQDFPFVLGGRLYSKLGKTETSQIYFEKYMKYAVSKSDLPTKFYEQGQYYQYCKRDDEKAIETYLKGLYSPPETNTFLQESYARKCRSKVLKLIQSNESLHDKFHKNLEEMRFFNDEE